MKNAAIQKNQTEKVVEIKQKSSPKVQKKTARAVEKVDFVKTAKASKFAPTTGVAEKTKKAAKKKQVAVSSAQILKPKKEKTKIVAAEPKSKTTKKVAAPVSAKKASRKEIAAVVSVKKAASKPQKIVASVKPKLEKPKVKSVVAVPKIELKKKKIVAAAATQKAAPKAQKVEVAKPETAAKKAKAVAPVVKSPAKISKSKSSIDGGKKKIEKIETAAKKVQSEKAAKIAEKPEKPKKEKTKSVAAPLPKTKLVEPKIAAESLPAKAKPKKTKPIGAAVFRGKRERYDFQVYPLDAVFDNVSAIYIISKRKTDRLKKGHHALVCIGQTDSVADELKKHARGKCVKKYAANVISILPEASEKKRMKIEEDLKAAHSITCNLG